jgi:phage gp29-like protein
MAKTTNKTAPNVVVQHINIRTISRRSQDIDTWKNAIKSFESILNPSRVLLYDLFDDIILDGQIEATWGKRRDAVLSRPLMFVRDGKEDEEISKILNSPSMRTMIKEIHNSIAWGYTLIQINAVRYDEDEEQYIIDYDLIPRRHVHPEKGYECVSREQSFASRDILYREPPLSRYMIWAGDPTDMGLLTKAAQYVIYKRGDFGDWAQFAEMFGMPFREARYDGYDENTRKALEAAMEAYGSAAYAVLPKNAEFKLHDAVKGTGSQLYQMLYNACNAEISKVILGNTLTTEQGEKGTQALGTVHKDGETIKNDSDRQMILDVLNGKFKAILKVFGFNVAGGEIWYRSEGKDWDLLQKKWTVLQGLGNRIPIEDDYLYEEFDVPKPANYNALREQMDNRIFIGPEPDTQPAPKNMLQRALDFFV